VRSLLVVFLVLRSFHCGAWPAGDLDRRRPSLGGAAERAGHAAVVSGTGTQEVQIVEELEALAVLSRPIGAVNRGSVTTDTERTNLLEDVRVDDVVPEGAGGTHSVGVGAPVDVLVGLEVTVGLAPAAN
jgi:hypothetical protein